MEDKMSSNNNELSHIDNQSEPNDNNGSDEKNDNILNSDANSDSKKIVLDQNDDHQSVDSADSEYIQHKRAEIRQRAVGVKDTSISTKEVVQSEGEPKVLISADNHLDNQQPNASEDSNIGENVYINNNDTTAQQVDDGGDNSINNESKNKTFDTNVEEEALINKFLADENNDKSSVIKSESESRDDSNLSNKDENLDIRKNSLARFFKNGKVKTIWLVVSGLVVLIVLFMLYKFLVPNSTPSSSGLGDAAMNEDRVLPNTNAKGDGTYDAKNAEDVRQKQISEAEEAAANNQSYSAKFIGVNQAQDEVADNGSAAVSFGDASAPKAVFYDDKGKTYSRDEALALKAQNMAIKGVTFGEGSVADPKVNGAAVANNQSANGNNGVANNNANKPIQSYVVQPLSTASSNSQTGAGENLEKNATDIDNWKDKYIKDLEKRSADRDVQVQKAYTDQVNALIEAVKPTSAKGGFNTVRYPKNSQPQASGSISNSPSGSGSQQQQDSVVLARAGEVYSGILTSTLNTDNGSEIIGKILSGPFKDSTIVGVAKPTENNVQFVFNRVLRKNKQPLAVNLLARQVGTNSLGMAGEIKKHYLQKYSALVVSSALAGVGEAYKQTAGSNVGYGANGTVVTEASDPSGKRIAGNAAGELGQQLSSDVRDLQKRKTTYITNSGTVFSLFVTEDIVENSKTSSKR